MKSVILSLAIVVATTFNASAQELEAPLMPPELVKNQAAAAVPANALLPLIFVAFIAVATSSKESAPSCLLGKSVSAAIVC